MKKDERVRHLGQIFTPNGIVHKMLELRKNKGSILEPSSGRGAFLSQLEKDAVGIELDGDLFNDKRVRKCDFFSYSIKNKFDTIIGNPPYVRFQDIQQSSKESLNMNWFDKRSNLYLFFIAKSIKHLKPRGELIFITPRNFLKATNSIRLNKELYQQGSMTHYYELGDQSVFRGYSPNCSIWRWVKGRKSKWMETGGSFCCKNGQIFFGGNIPNSRLGDYFEVKVGAVSGADQVFDNKRRGNKEFVCSMTAKDGVTRKMIYNRKDSVLKPHKNRLLARRIREFGEHNWWEWGRKYHEREGERIYVNCKTRNPKPFFVSDKTAYDGSVLALFPKRTLSLGQIAHSLNSIDWDSLGFVCGGRLLFTQRSLQNVPLEL